MRSDRKKVALHGIRTLCRWVTEAMLFPLHQTGTYFILQDIIFLSALVKKGVGGGAGAIESLI